MCAWAMGGFEAPIEAIRKAGAAAQSAGEQGRGVDLGGALPGVASAQGIG